MVRRRIDWRSPAVAVVLVAAVALLARLAFLGVRVAHWDEARVAYWILRYTETGEFYYRPIIHGPFFHHVNSVIFDLFGASDFSMRLVVALIGGLLPLSAWLFRDRLRDSEVVALALLLAANPVLLYYSQFMRNDLPLAAFMIFTLGFFVRAFDTRDRRYLYAGTATLALAFTTKENVLVYLLTWAGAVVLLFDHRLFLARDRDQEWSDVLEARVRRVGRGIRAWQTPLLVAFVEFFAIVVFFYAPRPDLWQAFSNPAMIPDVLHAGTVGAWEEFYSTWVTGGHQDDNNYLDFLSHLVDTLVFGAAPLLLLAVAGFVEDRYSSTEPRDLVAFCAYWGFVTLLGYPLITDIQAPWGAVHIVAPLAIPAAVGAALVYRWGRDAREDDDRFGVALAVVLLLLLSGQVAATAVQSTYLHPQDQYVNEAAERENKLIQYGQPAEGIRPTLDDIRVLSRSNEGTDVLFYGTVEVLYVPDERDNLTPPAANGWYERLPVAWYLELYGSEVDSTDRVDEVGQRVEQENPPIVIARAEYRDDLEPHLQGYEARPHELTIVGSETVVWVDREQLREAYELDA